MSSGTGGLRPTIRWTQRRRQLSRRLPFAHPPESGSTKRSTPAAVWGLSSLRHQTCVDFRARACTRDDNTPGLTSHDAGCVHQRASAFTSEIVLGDRRSRVQIPPARPGKCRLLYVRGRQRPSARAQRSGVLGPHDLNTTSTSTTSSPSASSSSGTGTPRRSSSTSRTLATSWRQSLRRAPSPAWARLLGPASWPCPRAPRDGHSHRRPRRGGDGASLRWSSTGASGRSARHSCSRMPVDWPTSMRCPSGSRT